MLNSVWDMVRRVPLTKIGVTTPDQVQELRSCKVQSQIRDGLFLPSMWSKELTSPSSPSFLLVLPTQ